MCDGDSVIPRVAHEGLAIVRPGILLDGLLAVDNQIFPRDKSSQKITKAIEMKFRECQTFPRDGSK